MHRRIHVEARDVLDLLGEGRIVGALEGAQPVWLQMVGVPDALHRAQADADSPGHGAAGPVCDLARGLGAGECEDPGQGFGRKRRPARRARSVLQQGLHACLGVTHLPPPDCGTAYPSLARNLGHGQPLGRQQDDPCTLDVLLGTVPVGGNRS